MTNRRTQRTQKDFIRQVIDKNVNDAQIATVQEVYPHSNKDDDSNFEADVVVNGVEQLSTVQITSPASDGISIPKAGDTVLIEYTDDDTPIITGVLWSNKDRPPVGLAGMYRNEFESSSSPLGDGNIYITGHTEHEKDVRKSEKPELSGDNEAERSVVQIAKHARGENVHPADGDTIPAKIELVDNPADDEAHISVEINKLDGQDSYAAWGMEFNAKTGAWKFVGPNGYGLISDGKGNFEWYGETMQWYPTDDDTGPLNIGDSGPGGTGGGGGGDGDDDTGTVSSAPSDGLYAQYDAKALNSFDGDTISSWPDTSGNNRDLNLSDGAPSYRENELGQSETNPAVYFDVSERIYGSFTDISPAYWLFVVVRNDQNTGGNGGAIFDGINNRVELRGGGDGDSDYRFESPGFDYFDIPVSSNDAIVGVKQNGGASVGRVNGSQAGSGSLGNVSLDGLQITGSTDGNDGSRSIGEILIYNKDQPPIADIETYLNDKWNIY